MPRFAVVMIPPAETTFYQRASAIIGYDIRAEQVLSAENAITAQLPNYDRRYARNPHKYGVHGSLVSAGMYRQGDQAVLQYEMGTIVRSFAPRTRFTLTAHESFITRWGKGGSIMALQYVPNAAVMMLHTLLVSRFAAYVTETKFQRNLRNNPNRYNAHDASRIEHFGWQHIFDDFNPHFTLLHPYQGTQRDATAIALADLFSAWRTWNVGSIALIVQPDTGAYWRIVEEFALSQ